MIPKNWKNYCRNDQFVYSHYILCGKITQQGFQLYCCTKGGRDKQGNTCWRLTPKRYADGWALAFKMGYKLARNLLGTSNLLTRNRIAYHPEPRQLFDRYCDRCTPPLEPTESDTIWHSANKTIVFASRDFGSIVMSIHKWTIIVLSHQPSLTLCPLFL